MGGEPSAAYLMLRGDAQTPGEPVAPGVPSVLRAGLAPYKIVPPTANPESSGRRLALARWLVQPNHPLTARVMVNRIWMHHFGRGSGCQPGELWPDRRTRLASRVAGLAGNRVCPQRLEHESHASPDHDFQRLSPELAIRSGNSPADPDNVLLSRMPMRRLEAEALYDSIVKVAGSLDSTAFRSSGGNRRQT